MSSPLKWRRENLAIAYIRTIEREVHMLYENFHPYNFYKTRPYPLPFPGRRKDIITKYNLENKINFNSRNHCLIKTPFPIDTELHRNKKEELLSYQWQVMYKHHIESNWKSYPCVNRCISARWERGCSGVVSGVVESMQIARKYYNFHCRASGIVYGNSIYFNANTSEKIDPMHRLAELIASHWEQQYWAPDSEKNC